MSLRICSIGDIMLGENVHHFRRSIATRYRDHFQRLIPPEVHAIVNGTDLVVGNLECSLMPDAERQRAHLDRAIYAAPESALDCFKPWRPPLVLNVANNHFGQHGSTAVAYTKECLSRRGIYCVGQTNAPLELAVNGRQVCIWGVSLIEDKHAHGYMKSTAQTLLDDLEWGEKSDGDLWILSIHWGEEYRTYPSESQEILARRLAAHGVDMILGHHPHVIQPVRFVGDKPVAYSHGNFLFDQNFSKLTRTGLMLVTDSGSRSVHYFILGSRNYRIATCRKISGNDLEAFCQRHRKRYLSFFMRLLMKLEMLSRAVEVPMEVWAHFFFQLKAKACRK